MSRHRKAHFSSNLDSLALAVHRNLDGAVERLVLRYQDRLFSYALRLLQNSFDAEEVTQDAFMRACRALMSRYDEARCRGLELGPWLFRITRNLAYSKRRAQHARIELPIPDSGDGLEGAMHHPAQALRELESSASCETLRRAMGHLDREARDLILLRFMEEMSYAEIASIVGAGEASVRGKVFRALGKLRYILSKSGGRNAL